jgi:ferric-dicitrate binding protein FerR (iron transport regulator)
MTEHDDSDIARVLRASGGRASPSDDMAQAVYEAVHAEWRATVERQKRKRAQRVWLAAAASVAVAAVALFLGRSFIRTPGELMADVSRSVGVVEVREGDSGEWLGATAAQNLRVGERIHTGANGRVALALRDGVSLRLDHDTTIALVSADRVDVTSGAVYIDSGVAGPSAARLQLGTPAGVVRHVGTQYEARILNSGTRVRVREGRVDVMPANGPSRTLEMGDQILVTGTGVEERSRIEPSSDEWDWASSAAPGFDINGKPVQEFLVWAGRETGLKLVFTTAESAAEARRAVLSGSIAGLDPDDALDAVLPTTSLKGTERDGQLVIELSGR